MKPKSLRQLKNAIDKARREYIWKRDADWKGFGRCISCNAVGNWLSIGHFFSRVHDFTTELGGDERNTQLQCGICNGHKRGNPREYAVGLVRKYGESVLTELLKKKQTPKYWGVKKLQELLDFYKQKLTEL